MLHLTAGLVERAEDWRWSSLWVREHGTDQQKAVLCDWPTSRPGDWRERVNAAVTEKEKSRWHLSLARGQPFGEHGWKAAAVKELGLEHTVRGEGGNQYGKDEE